MTQARNIVDTDAWPVLPISEWSDTAGTLHMWLQIVGKIRTKLETHVNHWWECTLYVSARGLSTTPMQYRDGRLLQIDFDFVEHRLLIENCNGGEREFRLEPMPVATFYAKLMDALHALDFDVVIDKRPNEVMQAIPFDEDFTHASYDPEYAQRFWRVLLQAERVFKIFRHALLRPHRAAAFRRHSDWAETASMPRFTRTRIPHP